MPCKRAQDVLVTSIAPIVWGSTYIVATELLPVDYPMTMATLRALPAGLILLVLTRKLPKGIWWPRVFVLGALNFTIFWYLLFVAAYRLPGGVAATIGASQTLIVIAFAWAILREPMRAPQIVAGVTGALGVALLVSTPRVALDPWGVLAGIGGAISMAFGTVLTKKWRPPTSLVSFTAWQLVAGGLLLAPVAMLTEPPLPELTAVNFLGLAHLGLIGAALAYLMWFRGIERLGTAATTALGFLSPVSAVLLGWIFLGQQLSLVQGLGGLLVLLSVALAQSRSSAAPKLALGLMPRDHST